MLRAYFVQEYDDPEGIAVIAETAKDAKKIAYNTGDFPCEWIELRVQWLRNANIEGLEKGVVEANTDTLRRGLYGVIYGHPCDICGNVCRLQELNGKAVCWHCYEEVD